MSQSNSLREVVATLLLMPAERLGPATSLAALNTSLGGARLGLALKRAGLQLPGSTIPATFGELEARLNGAAPGTEPVKSAAAIPEVGPPPDPAEGLQVGLDVQEIAALPNPADYWEDDFYRENFDKSEIAYAVVQLDPRIHLAGFWCAKEALRKCDPRFAGTPPASTAVAHDPDGKPYLLTVTSSVRSRLPHAVSISHSGPVASAVVAMAPPPAAPATPAPSPSSPAARPVVESAAPSSGGIRLLAGLLTLIAITLLYLSVHFFRS